MVVFCWYDEQRWGFWTVGLPWESKVLSCCFIFIALCLKMLKWFVTDLNVSTNANSSWSQVWLCLKRECFWEYFHSSNWSKCLQGLPTGRSVVVTLLMLFEMVWEHGLVWNASADYWRNPEYQRNGTVMFQCRFAGTACISSFPPCFPAYVSWGPLGSHKDLHVYVGSVCKVCGSGGQIHNLWWVCMCERSVMLLGRAADASATADGFQPYVQAWAALCRGNKLWFPDQKNEVPVV